MQPNLESVNKILLKKGRVIEPCFEGEPGAFFQIVDLRTGLQDGPDFDDLDDAFDFIVSSWS